MLADIYRDEWDADELSKSQILEETRAIFGKAIDKGVPRSTSHRTAFKERLKTSTDVFSAFRVHTQAQHMAELMTDEDGNRLPFREWAERVQPYVNHQNRAWLRTEFDTATRRAHNEADWQRFQEEADIYPNLEWVPSTSANPGQDHQPFWGTVLPINDPFWNEHKPGDRWNCKCSLRSTDKAPTRTPSASGKHCDPAPGLNTRPGSGEIFSDDHAYYPDTCGACPFAGSLRALFSDLARRKGNCNQCQAVRKAIDTEKTELIKQRKQEYKAKSATEWRKDGFFDNGGYLVTSKSRIAESEKSKQETAKFDKEHNMCLQAAKNGHAVEHLSDDKSEGTFDAKIDSIPTDLKRTKGAGNIQRYGKHAIRKQGAKQIFFQFDEWSNKHREAIAWLTHKGLHGFYILTSEPNIEHSF